MEAVPAEAVPTAAVRTEIVSTEETPTEAIPTVEVKSAEKTRGDFATEEPHRKRISTEGIIGRNESFVSQALDNQQDPVFHVDFADAQNGDRVIRQRHTPTGIEEKLVYDI